MTTSPLPADHDVGPAVLHVDGSLTLAGGPKLLNQSLVGHQFDGGQLDVLANAGTLCVTIRFAAGGERRFEYRGSCWYEIHKDVPISSTRAAPFTPRRWKHLVYWVVGGTMICVLAVSVCRPEADKQSSAEADKPSVTQPMITSEPKAMSAQPQVVAKPSAPPRELTPDEILASQELSFEQKRSQLYDLANVVEKMAKAARDETNYHRTLQRLGQYRVNFTPEAERGLLDLTKRVSGYMARLKQWEQDVEKSENLIRECEGQFHQMLQAGALDPKARTLFIRISGPHPIYLVGKRVPELLSGKILRLQVAAADLFGQLAAVRNYQHLMTYLSAREDEVRELSVWLFAPFEAAMAQMKPQDKHPLTAEEKASSSTELIQGQNTPSSRRGHRLGTAELFGEDDEYRAWIDRAKRRHEQEQQLQRENAEKRSRLKNGTMAKDERERLSAALSQDAGILENALGELLLDYPWPWPVPTTPSEKKMFTLTSRPAE